VNTKTRRPKKGSGKAFVKVEGGEKGIVTKKGSEGEKRGGGDKKPLKG